MTYSKFEQHLPDLTDLPNPTELPTSARAVIFREARAAKNYSIEDMAVACGLTALEITGIENGSNDDAGHLRRAAHALGLPLDGAN